MQKENYKLMKKYDLSVLVPSRNEMFVARTVENILRMKQGNTEVLVALDGQWAEPSIPDHEDVTLVYFPESIGQRAATNQLCRLSKAKYVMKLDAHSAVDEGFDVKLMADMQDDWTVIPTMYNLHAFDWVCIGQHARSGNLYEENDDIKMLGCGHTIYQGPTPIECPKCKGNMERLLLWQPRFNRRSYYYRFDKTLHFQYWGDYGKRPEAQGNIVETMSAQGSCFFLTREKYWELEISDEKLAGKTGWGQQGVEVACKTWLSGGKLMVNKNTWYSHMFRTQGGDFGFPFPMSGREVDETRKKSRELFIKDQWPKAIHSFQWLLDKFYPIPDWHDEKVQVSSTKEKGLEPSRSIVFYTHNMLKLRYAHKVQDQLKSIGLPIFSASRKPMPHFGMNVVNDHPDSTLSFFHRQLAALEASDTEIVYICEDDVIYHKSHFDFIPPKKDKFYYNQNFWRIRPEQDNFAVHFDANQVSGLVCYREFLLEYVRNRIKEIERDGFNRSYEPGGRNSDQTEAFKSQYPNIDIRHGNNVTKSKWSLADFRDKSTAKGWEEGTLEQIPGWNTDYLISLLSIK